MKTFEYRRLVLRINNDNFKELDKIRATVQAISGTPTTIEEVAEALLQITIRRLHAGDKRSN